MNALALTALLLLLAGCGCGPTQDDTQGDTSPPADTAPEGCGSGTWGEIEVDAQTVFVDIAADADGDGSQQAPFTSIQVGLDAAGASGGGTVAVAAGSYPETLSITWDHADVRLAGRCEDLVSIDASGGNEDTPGIAINAGVESVELYGFTLTGAPGFGVLIQSGSAHLHDCAIRDGDWVGLGSYRSGINPTTVVMERCEIRGNTGVGALLHDEDVTVTLRDSIIAGTRTTAEGVGGYGHFTRLGATTILERCELDGNTAAGIIAVDEGSSVSVTGSSVHDTQADGTSSEGFGIRAYDGAAVVVDTSDIVGNTSAGVLAHGDGSSISLSASTIRDTQPVDDGSLGFGVEVYEGATVEIEGSELTGNSNVGVWVLDPGSTAWLLDTTVSGTRTNPYQQNGVGIMTYDGGRLVVEGSVLSENNGAGALAMSSGSTLEMTDSAILDTHTQGGDIGGMAIEVNSGAAAYIERCELARGTNTAVFVVGEGTEATLIDTLVQDTRLNGLGEQGYGLEVQDRASLLAQGCDISGNSSASVMAQDEGSSLTLEACTVRDTAPKWEGELGLGIHAQLQASVVVRDSELSGHTTLGAVVVDPGTVLELERTSIEGTTTGGRYTAGIGVAAQNSGTLIATELTVTGAEGPGLMVSTMGSASCDGCTFDGNGFAGVVLLTGSSLRVENSTIVGCVAQENLGGGAGVYAENLHAAYPTELELRGNTMRDNTMAGVWLQGEGYYQLHDNTIEGGEGWERSGYAKCGDAVYASGVTGSWEDGVGVRISGNTLQNSRGAGVFLNEATATLDGNSWAGNGVDLITQGAGCEAAPSGLDDEPVASVELCPSGHDYGTCDDEFALVLELAELETGLRSPSSAGLHTSLPRHPPPGYLAVFASPAPAEVPCP